MQRNSSDVARQERRVGSVTTVAYDTWKLEGSQRKDGTLNYANKVVNQLSYFTCCAKESTSA